MFWLSIVLALLASAITLSGTSVLLGVPILALSLCGYAFVLRNKGKPAKAPINTVAMWFAIVVSILALVAAPLLAIPQ